MYAFNAGLKACSTLVENSGIAPSPPAGRRSAGPVIIVGGVS